MNTEHFNYGERNPSYKGDEAKYGAIHAWVRKRLPKPEVCEFCKLKPPVDLANKSGNYLRDLSDWNYLCRRCHMDSDGRNDSLRKSGKSRKLPNKMCLQCNREFHRDSRDAKYCSRDCYTQSKIGNGGEGKVQ